MTFEMFGFLVLNKNLFIVEISVAVPESLIKDHTEGEERKRYEWKEICKELEIKLVCKEQVNVLIMVK